MNSQSIIAAFISRYGHLQKDGLKINGKANLIGETNVISISTPFIFDNRLIPNEFMGLTVRRGINENDLPDEFKNSDKEIEYIWAYQRFEIFVDNHSDLIRQKLGNIHMTRDEILDAICFGDFETHKTQCKKFEVEGKIPKWSPR
ncbi:MAG TPA: hypothetical protein VD908_02050 [Cytophagales bacterium]|nr:hypothetical protein [Cytophagales bacterium]